MVGGEEGRRRDWRRASQDAMRAVMLLLTVFATELASLL
jgi:hypothetical protein